jgi:hypothetical protein
MDVLKGEDEPADIDQYRPIVQAALEKINALKGDL